MHSGEDLAGPAGLDAGQLRLLAWAALASVALHLLLLYALPMLEQAIRAPSAPALKARLAKPPPEPSARTEVQPVPQSAPAARPAVPRPPVAAPRAETKPLVASPAIEPVKPSAEPAPAGSSAAAPSPQPVAGSGAAQTPVPASAGPDPGSVARYRLELMDAARRYKRYPRVAQDNGWEGRVELHLAFAESGALSSLAVKKSAGRAALDDAALAMLGSAQAQTPVPVALRGKAFVVEIPVDFFLRDAER